MPLIAQENSGIFTVQFNLKIEVSVSVNIVIIFMIFIDNNRCVPGSVKYSMDY